MPLAIERWLAHSCYHIGQIVQLARIHAGEKWNTLAIAKGGSKEFNRAKRGQPGESDA